MKLFNFVSFQQSEQETRKGLNGHQCNNIVVHYLRLRNSQKGKNRHFARLFQVSRA